MSESGAPTYRLLVLTSQFPYPPQQGATIRSYNLLRELAQRAEIDLLSFVDDPVQLTAPSPLHALCRTVAGERPPARTLSQRALSVLRTNRPDMALRCASPTFAGLVQAHLESQIYDALLCVGIEMGPYLEQAAAQCAGWPAERQRPRLIFDDINAEYVLQQRAFETDLRQWQKPRRWLGAAYSFVQWRRLRRFEAGLCRLADAVVAVSEADKIALGRLVPGLEATVVPNGVDLERYRPDADVPPVDLPQPALVFTGKMDFRPNVDAACWFVEEVLPKVRASCPQVTFVIVGRDPHPRVQALAGLPGVCVTGPVEDDLPYFARGALYVVPLRVGGGTRLKVLTAMAVGAPIVSTSLGCEGIGATDGRHLVIADRAEDFARHVIDLLQDAGRRRQLGLAAHLFAEDHYGWPAIAPRLEAIYARPKK